MAIRFPVRCTPIPSVISSICSMEEYSAVLDLYRTAQDADWRPFKLSLRASAGRWGLTRGAARKFLDTMQFMDLLTFEQQGPGFVVEVECPEGFVDVPEDQRRPRPQGVVLADSAPRPQPTQAGSVYLIRAGSVVKIGFTTTSPKRRLASFQTGSPLTLELVGSIPGTYGDEQALHKRYAHLRTRGEWFALGAADIAAILGGRT